MKIRIVSALTALKYCIISRLRIFTLNIHPTASLANNCVIKRGSSLAEGVVLDSNVELYRHVSVGKYVKIGSFTSINDSTTIECGSIGKYCSVGVDVIIGPGVHPLNFFTSSTYAT